MAQDGEEHGAGILPRQLPGSLNRSVRSNQGLGSLQATLLVRRGNGELIANPSKQPRLRDGGRRRALGETQTLRPLDAE